MHRVGDATCCGSPAPSGVMKRSAGPTTVSLVADHLLSTALTEWLCLGSRPGLSSSSVNKEDPSGNVTEPLRLSIHSAQLE